SIRRPSYCPKVWRCRPRCAKASTKPCAWPKACTATPPGCSWRPCTRRLMSLISAPLPSTPCCCWPLPRRRGGASRNGQAKVHPLEHLTGRLHSPPAGRAEPRPWDGCEADACVDERPGAGSRCVRLGGNVTPANRCGSNRTKLAPYLDAAFDERFHGLA